MPEDGRAIFIIDPEKYMQEKSDQAWAIVVKQLPEKIKLVFAQRPGDALISSEIFGSITSVVHVPERSLDSLGEADVDELLQLRSRELGCSIVKLREVLKRYNGHPYAIQAALDIVEKTKSVKELPQDPTPSAIAEGQWDRICEISDDAIRLFKGYAIVEVGVPDDVIEPVSKIDADAFQHLLADKYLRGLLREEGYGRRIYHAIFADYVLGQMGEGEEKEYHRRAVEVYREKLKEASEKQTKPDALAAMRLAEHVLEAEGGKAFIDTFVNECTEPLLNLGLLDAAMNLSDRALGMIQRHSREEAAVFGNLGLIYMNKGKLDKAEQMHLQALGTYMLSDDQQGIAGYWANLGNLFYMKGELSKAEEVHKKSLMIEERLGRLEGVARQYGNLGLIYQTRGELDKAEEMHLKSLEIEKKLGRLEGIASDYGNLGLIYMDRGELDKAEEMYRRALQIDEKLGLQEGMANQYGNLGLIYGRRGELDKAEEMQKKALEIDQRIGGLEGAVDRYGNLGAIYEAKGDMAKAVVFWERARDICKTVGMGHMIEIVERNLRRLLGEK